MSEGWFEDEWERVHAGLALIGWSYDSRITNEDSLIVLEIADRANAVDGSNPQADEQWERLAEEAFDYIGFYVSEPSERAATVTGPYLESQYVRPLIPLINEATLTYYRGYFASSFALLLIGLESYLRDLLSLPTGGGDPTFRQLRTAILRFPQSRSRDAVGRLLSGLYSRYESHSPTRFYFNRHGLLHGLRDPMTIDRLNSCRMIQLFDLLCGMETGRSGRFMNNHAKFDTTFNAYSQCVRYGRERPLLAYE